MIFSKELRNVGQEKLKVQLDFLLYSTLKSCIQDNPEIKNEINESVNEIYKKG